MKKYYIKAKQGYSDTVSNLIREHLSFSEKEVRGLLSIGAVWDWSTRQRIKNPDRIITGELVVVHRPQFQVRPYPFEASDIIYEEKGFVVVCKKAGYPTIPTPFSDINSLSCALGQYYQSEKSGLTINAINRLDTDTHGLVFFGKESKTGAALYRMFKERKVKKWYLAGTDVFSPVKENYFISDSLEWHGKTKQAGTFIHLLAKNEQGFCFLVHPYTGRTHQIRKHFAAHLAPVRGDSLYGKYSRDERLDLVCFAYIFPHPITGKRMKVAYLPDSLEQ